MGLTIGIIQITLLSILCIQDFKQRMISGIVLAALAASIVADVLLQKQNLLFLPALLTLALLISQFLIIKIVYSIKSGSTVRLADTLIGWGDIVLLVILCFFFSPSNFFLFYLTALLLSIMGTIVAQKIFRSSQKLVPLAGYITALAVVVKAVELLMGFDRYNDELLLSTFSIY